MRIFCLLARHLPKIWNLGVIIFVFLLSFGAYTSILQRLVVYTTSNLRTFCLCVGRWASTLKKLAPSSSRNGRPGKIATLSPMPNSKICPYLRSHVRRVLNSRNILARPGAFAALSTVSVSVRQMCFASNTHRVTTYFTTYIYLYIYIYIWNYWSRK